MIAAAVRLFVERGVREVSLTDIAAEVGLARNSLYRYFPDKPHILAAWFRSQIVALIETGNTIAEGNESPSGRLDKWIAFQLEYLATPAHQAMIGAIDEMQSLPDETRREIGARHHELYASLERIVSAVIVTASPESTPLESGSETENDDASDGRARRDTWVITMLLTGLLGSAAELIRNGSDRELVTAELLRATAGTVGATQSGS